MEIFLYLTSEKTICQHLKKIHSINNLYNYPFMKEIINILQLNENNINFKDELKQLISGVCNLYIMMKIILKF